MRMGHLGAEGTVVHGNTFFAALENWWLAEREACQRPHAASTDLPFAGGWAIFLSYEMAQEVEPRLSLPRAALPWRAFALRTPCALIHDRTRDRVIAVAEADSADLLDRIEADARLAAAEPDAPDEGFRVKSIQRRRPGCLSRAGPSRKRVRRRGRHLPNQPLASLARGARARPGRRRALQPTLQHEPRAVRGTGAVAGCDHHQLVTGASGARRGTAGRYPSYRRDAASESPPGR